MPPKTIQALLEDYQLLGGEQFALVEAVRKLVKKALPSITEDVKYGGIIFTSGVSFGGVFAYKDHVSVEFSKGALIADTLGHLEGSGKGRRHIKLFTAKDIKAKNLAHYLPLALDAARKSTPN